MAEKSGGPILATSNSGLRFEICDVQGRGKGVVATENLGANEEVFQEPALLSVKTFMILSGVVVLRRSKVEKAYELLRPQDKLSYKSLHPLCEMNESDADASEELLVAEGSQNFMRNRLGKEGSHTNEPVREEVVPPTAQQHREIWDNSGFHYCDEEDVYINRRLHLAIFPGLLSLLTGCAYAYWFKGHYIRSILAACVLFFAMLGPVSARLFYCGSQGLFLQASRLNHSCLPNTVWQIDGQRAPLGGQPQGQPAQTAASGAGEQGGSGEQRGCRPPINLSLRTKHCVKRGEELTIDYISELAHLDAAERRNLLQQDYGFLCSCPRCMASERTASTGPEEEAEE